MLVYGFAFTDSLLYDLNDVFILEYMRQTNTLWIMLCARSLLRSYRSIISSLLTHPNKSGLEVLGQCAMDHVAL